MSYFSQRILNNFPLWSKVRMDPSSFGARAFGAFAKELEVEQIANVILTGLNLEGQSLFDLPYVYSINETEAWPSSDDADIDNFPLASATIFPDFLDTGLTYPHRVIGMFDGEEVEIFKSGDTGSSELIGIFSFLYSAPQSLIMKKPYILKKDNWILIDELSLHPDDNPPGYGFYYEVPEEKQELERRAKISITVKDSTHYQRYCMLPDGAFAYVPNGCDTDAIQDAGYQGEHKITVSGYDDQGPDEGEISDFVRIDDDGCYLTQKAFTHVTRIEGGGFNGTVTVKARDWNLYEYKSPFHLAISPDATTDYAVDDGDISTIQEDNASYESPLILTTTNTGGGTYLDSWFKLHNNGTDYRREAIDMEIEEDYRELLSSQWLLDDAGESYEATDMAFNWFDSKLYIADRESRVHIYTISPSDFVEWNFTRTRKICIDIEPLVHRVAFGEEIPMWSFHKIMRSSIKMVAFKREKPHQVNNGSCPDHFTGDYLQEDFTWAEDPYWFSGITADLPENSWKDKKFSSGIFDELGQWNFYCEVIAERNSFNELERLEIAWQAGDEEFKFKDHIPPTADSPGNPHTAPLVFTTWDTEEYDSCEEDPICGTPDPCAYGEVKEFLLKDRYNDEMFRSSTAVYCEYLKADKTLALGIPHVDSWWTPSDVDWKWIPYGIFFEEEDKLSVLWTIESEGSEKIIPLDEEDPGSTPGMLVEEWWDANWILRQYELVSHIYLPDTFNKTLYFREKYDYVGVQVLPEDMCDNTGLDPEDANYNWNCSTKYYFPW